MSGDSDLDSAMAAASRRRRPEILAPAGDRDALIAALRNGADAVYFGLDAGFNARARAANFSLDSLPETVATIHLAGARAYLALNTLVFESELPAVEGLIRAAVAAGVDALIVQDPAVALLSAAICPELEIHASTQMTVSSPEAARFARGLGATRVVLPRELSVAEIRKFVAASGIEAEVFVHGALCVAWSGQCLTSEAWGQRSANRGQCAQSCRLPYELVVDGSVVDTGDVRYLLSPKDLAGVRAVPELVDLGIAGLKIEGRQKGPHYVATAVAGYRRWVDAVVDGIPVPEAEALVRSDLRRMTLAYARGFGDGFLGGSDHQSLVEGRFPKHRGIYAGRVEAVLPRAVAVTSDPAGRPWTGALAIPGPRSGPEGSLAAPLSGCGGAPDAATGPAAGPIEIRPGLGVVFDSGHPEDEDEPGGPVFAARRTEGGWILGFGTPGPDLSRVRPGDRVWVTSDPSAAAETTREVAAGPPMGRIPLDLAVTLRAGAPLAVAARAGGFEVRGAAATPAAPAAGRGLDAAILREKLGGVGGTPFHLRALDCSAVSPGLHVPVSEIKALRREIVRELEGRVARGRERAVDARPVLPRFLAASAPSPRPAAGSAPPELLPLCRTLPQVEAAIAAGAPEIELDWMEMAGLGAAVARVREAGRRVTVATLRIQKPGEEGLDRRLLDLAPDGILVRHLGGVMEIATRTGPRPAAHGDFSLNVTNALAAGRFLDLGLATLTAAFDLDETQLFSLLESTDAGRFTVMVHHRIPTFHTEHCLYAHLLSQGRDFRTCGRPCERHEAGVKDEKGRVHPVIVDVACRNTVFNAESQSAAHLVPRLLAAGVRRFRVEFVRESRTEAAAILGAYGSLLAGLVPPERVVSLLGVKTQQGVMSRAETLVV